MYKSLKEMLLTALLDGGIEKLVKDISEYFGYPVMVTDVGYNLIACYPEETQEDPLWDAILQFKSTPPDFINKFYKDNMMPLAVNNVEPYYLNWGCLKDYPRILVNLNMSKKAYGYFSILCDKNSPEMMEAIKIVGSVCTIALQKEYMDSPPSEDYQTMFLKYLFDEKKPKKEHLRNWKKNLHGSVEGPYYVGYCSVNRRKELISPVGFIQAVIKKSYPGILFFSKNADLIFLFTSMKTRESVQSFVKILLKNLHGYKLSFGISNQFYELEYPLIYLKQANYACLIASTKGLDYMEYRNCVLEQMITSIYAVLPRESYIHEAIEQLHRYDKNNNTEYLSTLMIYVKSLFNAKRTTESLHIHRNTLPHRLEMIQKISGIDLNNTETCIVLLINAFMENDN